MKILKYAYIAIISLLLLTPAFILWVTRAVVQVVVKFFVEWPLRKLVYYLMLLHEWMLSKVGIRVKNPLDTPRIEHL